MRIGVLWEHWVRIVFSLARVCVWVSGGAILLSIVVLIREAAGRYLFNAPADYAYELTSVMVIVILYSSLAHTASIDGHVSSDVIFSRLPPRLQSAILLAGDVFAALIGMAIAVYTFRQVRRSLETGAVVPDLFQLPLAGLQFVVVFGSTIFVLVCVTKIPGHVRDLGSGCRLRKISDITGEPL